MPPRTAGLSPANDAYEFLVREVGGISFASCCPDLKSFQILIQRQP
jgi:hypothetical protein